MKIQEKGKEENIEVLSVIYAELSTEREEQRNPLSYKNNFFIEI